VIYLTQTGSKSHGCGKYAYCMEVSGSRDGCCQVYLTQNLVLTWMVLTAILLEQVGAGSDSRSGSFQVENRFCWPCFSFPFEHCHIDESCHVGNRFRADFRVEIVCL
jgi:hypothetical protein